MPLFRSPNEENDSGYAISSYREIDPKLVTMANLSDLAAELRLNGISLVLDFVFNHTSKEHAWAQRACAGDPECRDYYLIFPDRTQPDAYERTIREVFPDEHPGAFTYFEQAGGWVWTTFHSYQSDLNYRNPAVFTRMAEEMLFLANIGNEETNIEVDLAVRRILLIHGIILTIGGIPLIYLGDEIGDLNDYTYHQNPSKANDSRWVHRPESNPSRLELRNQPVSLQNLIFSGIKKLIEVRKSDPVFSGLDTQMMDTGNEHVLGFILQTEMEKAIVLANFNEQSQILPSNLLRVYGKGAKFLDLLAGDQFGQVDIQLEGYSIIILKFLD